MSNFIFTLSIIFSCSSFISHEHHVSITTLMLKEENRKLEMTIKLTAHDLEYYFEKEKNIDLKLGHLKENLNANEMIISYINEHFILKINDRLINLDFIGKETENDESLWIYLEGYLPEKVNSIKVKNDILTQTFENQQNIVHLEGLFKESYTFNGLFREHTFYKE